MSIGRRTTDLEALAGSNALHNFLDLGTLVEARTRHQLPVVEHALREGLPLSALSQIGSETEGLHDGQVGLHGEHGSTGPLLLREHLSTSLVEYGVNTTNGVLRALNFGYEERQTAFFDSY